MWVGYRTDKNPADNPDGLKGNVHPNIYGIELISEETFHALEPIAARILAAKPLRVAE